MSRFTSPEGVPNALVLFNDNPFNCKASYFFSKDPFTDLTAQAQSLADSHKRRWGVIMKSATFSSLVGLGFFLHAFLNGGSVEWLLTYSTFAVVTLLTLTLCAINDYGFIHKRMGSHVSDGGAVINSQFPDSAFKHLTREDAVRLINLHNTKPSLTRTALHQLFDHRKEEHKNKRDADVKQALKADVGQIPTTPKALHNQQMYQSFDERMEMALKSA